MKLVKQDFLPRESVLATASERHLHCLSSVFPVTPRITYSTILPGAEVRLTCLQSPGSSFLPFLKAGRAEFRVEFSAVGLKDAASTPIAVHGR